MSAEVVVTVEAVEAIVAFVHDPLFLLHTSGQAFVDSITFKGTGLVSVPRKKQH